MKTFRKVLLCMLTLVFLLSLALPVYAGFPGQGIGVGLQKKAEAFERNLSKFSVMEQNKVKIRNHPVHMDVPPVIKEGRTLIPVRAVTQALGANVDWDAENLWVTITRGDVTIEFDLKDGDVYVDGVAVAMEAPPGMINNRVFVPIRFIAETLGERISYDPDTGEIDLGDEVGGIAGQVTVDPSGEGIENVMIYFWDSEDKAVTRTRTDMDGYYEIDDITVGTYRVTYTKEGYHEVTLNEVPIQENSVLTRNVRMQPLRAGSISGTIENEEEEVIAGVMVVLIKDNQGLKRVLTDSEGEFSFAEVLIGDYQLSFEHEDYEPLLVDVEVIEGTESIVDRFLVSIPAD